MFKRLAVYSAFETRYDYYSARTVFRECLTFSGLEDKDTYEAKEIKAIAAAVGTVGSRAERVAIALKALIS